MIIPIKSISIRRLQDVSQAEVFDDGMNIKILVGFMAQRSG
jgi:hypothetical protein